MFLLIQTYLESYHTVSHNYISTKISKSLGILAKLRHTVPSNILLNMCQSHTTLFVLWYSCLGPSCLDKFGKNLGSAKTCPSLDYLRASFCKYRESGDSFKIFNFLIFCPNKAFSELFSKIQLKDPKALEFFQNRGKFENRHFGLPRPLKIDKNDAFSFRSCW